MASVYPSTQWGEAYEPGLSCYAASDIWQGAIVRIASSQDWGVQMVATTTEEPIGIARDFAAYGEQVDVICGQLSVTNVVAGGSVQRMSQVHVVGTSSGVHPKSGVTVTYPVAGAVVPASGYPLWSVGQAWTSAAVSDLFAVKVHPRQLVGLATESNSKTSPW